MKALQNIGLIGVPFDKGQKKYGVGIAPAALRSAGLIAELQEISQYSLIFSYSFIQQAPVLIFIIVYNQNMSTQKRTYQYHFIKAFNFGGVGIPTDTRNIEIVIEYTSRTDGINVKDYGDVEITHICETDNTIKNMRNLAEVSMCNKHLSMKVAEVLNDDRLVLTIGGDHSIGVGESNTFTIIKTC